jgi:hypothetical protein
MAAAPAKVAPSVPQSAQPRSSEAPKLTEEERAARYKELRERLAVSRIYVRPPAGIVCRWVRRDDANDISYHEWLGFVVAKDDPKEAKHKRRFQTAVPIKEDGTYIVGDVILMEIDQDTYEFFLAERLRMANAAPAAAKTGFKEQAAQKQVPTFERNRAGQVI